MGGQEWRKTSYEVAKVFQARHGDDIINQSINEIINTNTGSLLGQCYSYSILDRSWADQASYSSYLYGKIHSKFQMVS